MLLTKIRLKIRINFNKVRLACSLAGKFLYLYSIVSIVWVVNVLLADHEPNDPGVPDVHLLSWGGYHLEPAKGWGPQQDTRLPWPQHRLQEQLREDEGRDEFQVHGCLDLNTVYRNSYEKTKVWINFRHTTTLTSTPSTGTATRRLRYRRTSGTQFPWPQHRICTGTAMRRLRYGPYGWTSGTRLPWPQHRLQEQLREDEGRE